MFLQNKRKEGFYKVLFLYFNSHNIKGGFMMNHKYLKKFVYLFVFIFIFNCFFFDYQIFAKTTTNTIQNDTFWKDTSGNPIYSQGGGIFKFGNTYYWYGVKYNGAVSYYNNPSKKNSDSSFNAITCYSSTDLVNWKFENNVLTSSTSGLEGSAWLGRMGVVYNANTKQYVLLSQFTGTNGSGELFATCDTPTGNFMYNHIQTSITNMVNNMTGDQSVFTDDDGKSYVICSSAKGRGHLYVVPINEANSLSLGTAVNIFNSTSSGREGNCMFKYNGTYYFCSSDLHGWNSSHCYVLTSQNILGPYSSESIMAGTDFDFCHVSQTGFFVTVPGSSGTTVIFCGDRWSDFAGNGLGYNEWCPITFDGTTPTFHSLSQWSLNAADGTWKTGSGNNYVLNSSFEADRISQTSAAGWTTWSNLSSGTPNSNVSVGHTGNWAWKLYNSNAYQGSIYQNITGLSNGTYTLTAWVESSGGQNTAQIFAKNFGATELDSSINTAIGNWKEISIPNVNITNGSCQIGMFTDANAGNWCKLDDISLVKN